MNREVAKKYLTQKKPGISFPVLIVEDDPVSAQILENILIKAGYETLSVKNGRQALEAFQQSFFPIVLTDWMMPEMDGPELCQRIRKSVIEGYVFIVLLTARSSKADMVVGLETGADDYLIKPVDPVELMARLNTAARILQLEKSLVESNKHLQQEIEKRRAAEQALKESNDRLEETVLERTAQLVKTNKELVLAVERANKMTQKAEIASEAKNEFLANMSHEIRTPLYGVIGMVEVAKENQTNGEQKAILDTIDSEANALLLIVNEVLDFAKIEAGKFELDEIPFDLIYLVKSISDSFELRAQKKGLAFSCFLSPDVPFQLIGDPGRLRQILNNLMNNALKFTHQGEIHLRVEISEDFGGRGSIRFSVKDTGIGVPKDRQTAIFESFVQADGSTTREYGGTGIGLSISKKLAEMMGGEIGVESDTGEGSTFWFTSILTKQTEAEATREDGGLDLTDLRVLVVYDHKNSGSDAREHLKSLGCKTVEAVGGKEATSILSKADSAKEPFSLLLVDSQMKDMGGFDLARQIRATDAGEKIPIIYLSSFGQRGDGERCKKVGIEGYLTNPIKADDLCAAIEMVLGCPTQNNGHPVTKHMIAEGRKKDVQILLVEDYPTSRQLGERNLRSAGYKVDLAENGQQAVDAWKKKHYDLILMDVQMPVMDGFAATKAIRMHETEILKNKAQRKEEDKPASSSQHPASRNRVPIIAMTAHAMKGYREKCLDAGMDDYVTKPLRKPELHAMVAKWCMPTTGSCDNTGPAVPRSDTNRGITREQDGSGEDGSPLCFDEAVAEFGGDKEFLRSVLSAFLSNARMQITAIREGVSVGDSEVVRKEAHSIKGGAAELYAHELSGIAYQLENMGKSGDMTGSAGVIEKIQNELDRLEIFRGIENEDTCC